MVTGNPALVSLAAALLEEVVKDNPDVLPRLYETGVFFFALAYGGSNLVEIARLLQVRDPPLFSTPSAPLPLSTSASPHPCPAPRPLAARLFLPCPCTSSSSCISVFSSHVAAAFLLCSLVGKKGGEE